MAKIKYKIGKKIYEFEVSEDLANGMGDLRREAWRDRKRKANHETLISLDEMSENGSEIPGCIEDTLEEVIARETQEEKAVLLEQLNVAISFLREEQVELVRLHIFEGKSLAQIAREYMLDETIIYKRWYRLVAHLKKILKNLSK